MVMVVPVDGDVKKAQHVAEEDGAEVDSPDQRSENSAGCPSATGARSSSTMMVMMMARTPSLNASSRVVRNWCLPDFADRQICRNLSVDAVTPRLVKLGDGCEVTMAQ